MDTKKILTFTKKEEKKKDTQVIHLIPRILQTIPNIKKPELYRIDQLITVENLSTKKKLNARTSTYKMKLRPKPRLPFSQLL